MNMTLNNTYNFLTLAPSILGTNYKLMKVKAIMTANEAIKYRDIHTLHKTMLNQLPNRLPKSIDDCTFILFNYVNVADKDNILLAYEYIDPYSIEQVNKVNIDIKVIDASTSDISIIRNRLIELGYGDFTISTFDDNPDDK